MRFTVNGKLYTYDAARLSVGEAIYIYDKTRLSVRSLMTALAEEMDARAIKAIVYLAMRRAGEKVDFDTLDFDVFEVATSFEADVEIPDPDDERWIAPDPTVSPGSSLSGMNPTLEDSNTWPPSPITSTSLPQ